MTSNAHCSSALVKEFSGAKQLVSQCQSTTHCTNLVWLLSLYLGSSNVR